MDAPRSAGGWRNLGEQPVVETPWFRLRQARVELPGGRQLDHYLLRLPPLTMTAMVDEQRIEWVPISAGPELIAAGQVRDASTAAALLWLQSPVRAPAPQDP